MNKQLALKSHAQLSQTFGPLLTIGSEINQIFRDVLIS